MAKPGRPDKTCEDEAKSDPRFVNSATRKRAEGYLAGLVGIVLPALFGALGAIAGQTRETYERIKEDKLMPRHTRLWAMPVLLGLVAGVAVGLLFVTTGPGNTDAAKSVLQGAAASQLHLSTSAYCFVAGFGAEAVFHALDSLVERIFAQDSAKSKAKTPTA